MNKLIVSGSRTITDRKWVYRVLDEMHAKSPIEMIVSGVALYWMWDKDPDIGGPDRYAVEWANMNDIPVKPFPADWKKGPGAGMNRNVNMARFGDACVAFWDGESSGTQHMIKFMELTDKPCRVERQTLETSLFDD